MKRTILALLCLLVLVPLPLAAQSLEPQIRILVHSHFFDQTNRVGVATWSILPDVTRENFGKDNPTRLLFVLGTVYKFAPKPTGEYNWLEVMPGTLFEINPSTKAGAWRLLLNTRAYFKWENADLYLENQIRHDLVLISGFATRPFKLKKLEGRFGFEGETIIPLNDKGTTGFQIGPRMSVKLRPDWLAPAVVLFVNQNGKLALRTYVKIGKWLRFLTRLLRHQAYALVPGLLFLFYY